MQESINNLIWDHIYGCKLDEEFVILSDIQCIDLEEDGFMICLWNFIKSSWNFTKCSRKFIDFPGNPIILIFHERITHKSWHGQETVMDFHGFFRNNHGIFKIAMKFHRCFVAVLLICYKQNVDFGRSSEKIINCSMTFNWTSHKITIVCTMPNAML